MTPSLTAGIFPPSGVFRSAYSSLPKTNSPSSELVLDFLESFLKSFSEPTNGPACGFPSLPSTGASFVPTSYFDLVVRSTTGDGIVSTFAFRGCCAVESVAWRPSWAAATRTVASDGKRRSKRGEGRLLNFIVVYIQELFL